MIDTSGHEIKIRNKLVFKKGLFIYFLTLLFLSLFSLLGPISSFGKVEAKPAPMGAEEYIEVFDSAFYRPQEKGLKDLVFDVKISGLETHLKNKISLGGEVKNVFFRVYWTLPYRYDVDVLGMPEGFKELKEDLKNLIEVRMDSVLPLTLKEKLKNFKLEKQIDPTSLGTVQIKAHDESSANVVSDILYTFDKNNRLTEIAVLQPYGPEVAKLSLSKRPWSDEQWVVDEIQTKTQNNNVATTARQRFKYATVGNFTFINRIRIETKQKLLQFSNKNKIIQKDTAIGVVFYNYKVNSGEALKHFKAKNSVSTAKNTAP